MMEGRDSSEKEDESIVEDELFKAAIYNQVDFFDNSNTRGRAEEYFCRKTGASNNNILHIALRHGSCRFADEAWKRFPHLICKRNLDGNTPLHLTLGNSRYYTNGPLVKKVCRELTAKRPWRIQNSMGNTLLHEAIIHNQFEVAGFLVDKDPSLAEIVNASMEAPLHLALQHFNLDNEEASEGQKECFTKVMEDDVTNLAKKLNCYCPPQDLMGALIRLLLQKAPYVAWWRDASGLSPLHRAALLPTFYNLAVVKKIIECCPQSTEVCDSTGKTILHHLVNRIDFEAGEGEDLLRNTLIYSFVNYQDEQGNTAGHLAAISNDINMLSAILSLSNLNWNLKNKEGLSIKTLSGRLNVKLQMIEKPEPIMTKKMCYAAEAADVEALCEMPKSLAFLDDIRDSEGRNILHKLFEIKWGHIIIPDEMFSYLNIYADAKFIFSKSDKNGDTPTHIFAQLIPDTIMIYLATGPRDYSPHGDPNERFPECRYPHLSKRYQEYSYVWTNLGGTDYYKELINWWVEDHSVFRGLKGHFKKNANGNTALHEALIAKNYPVFEKLSEWDGDATALVNNRNQTILHLLVILNPMPQVSEGVMTNIIKNNTEEERHSFNEDGVSLVTLAIQAGNIEFAAKLCFVRPRIAALVDPTKSQTFWHQLVDLPPIPPSFNFAESSFTDEAVCCNLQKKDKQGKTALHLALESHRFDLAETFLGLGGKLYSNGSPVFQEHLLKIPNTEGITPADIIGELPYVSPEFEEFIRRVSTMIGIRSKWGIPSTQMKDYVNTMGVMAALLTTITFTAGFTVPGGFNQEKGTPLLMSEPSFQVFVSFDIIAMCLSMMVLFCLLWIMATGNKSKALVLLDISIILLQASFYTTFVTFMTGLYATTHAVKHYVAVAALVLCSMLILLMQKNLVMKLIIPSGKAVLIFFDKGFRNVRKLRKKINVNYRYHRNSPRPAI